MSFLRSKMDVGLTPPIEYLPGAASEAIVLGEALSVVSGKLTKCGATTAPAYISVGPVKEGVVPVIKVQKYMIFEVPLSAAGSSLVIGQKVTLNTDGLQVTATTTDGVAEIVAFNGKAQGDTVLVRF